MNALRDCLRSRRAKGEGASIEECWCWVLWSYGAARLGTQAVVVELTSWLTFFFSRASENRAFRLGNRFNWFEIRLRPQTAYALPVKPHTSHTKVPHTHTGTLLSDHDAHRGGRPGARDNGPQGAETTKGTTNGRHQAPGCTATGMAVQGWRTTEGGRRRRPKAASARTRTGWSCAGPMQESRS